MGKIVIAIRRLGYSGTGQPVPPIQLGFGEVFVRGVSHLSLINSTELERLLGYSVPTDIVEFPNEYGRGLLMFQLLDFFKDHDKEITQAMIQNYIRDNLLPPPHNKRYYTKEHIILLTLINDLKSILPISDIKTLMKPIQKDPHSFEDDVITIESIYDHYVELKTQARENWKDTFPVTSEQIEQAVQSEKVGDDEAKTATMFLLVLTMVAQSATLQEIAKKIIRDYFTQE
jgi:DNA-binding transcriptional MerR regulator